jgi:predicted NodU family carbamoyl transferase
MQRLLEMFKPFASIMKEGNASEWFDIKTENLYILLVVNVLNEGVKNSVSMGD